MKKTINRHKKRGIGFLVTNASSNKTVLHPMDYTSSYSIMTTLLGSCYPLRDFTKS